MSAAAIALAGVRKTFGDFIALHDVSFEIADNEFFTLLGPSGCGKTTLLRLIAGFEATTGGTIHLYGEEIEDLPPNKRPVNTVFQNYALFPHMSVAENIAFGLEMLGWSRRDVAGRVREMVQMVRLGDFAARRPAQLSGGQQQRVALARAMAPNPKVLLLDEPLSALDLKLRQEMRAELKRLQRETAITFIFVTHDQEEALSMSDRIAVMSAGRVQQIGTPREVYDAPANRFVSDFVGETNLIPARIAEKRPTGIVAQIDGGARMHVSGAERIGVGTRGHVSIRPEALSMVDPPGELRGTLGETTYLGTASLWQVALDGGPVVTIRRPAGACGAEVSEGGDVSLAVAPGTARFLVD